MKSPISTVWLHGSPWTPTILLYSTTLCAKDFQDYIFPKYPLQWTGIAGFHGLLYWECCIFPFKKQQLFNSLFGSLCFVDLGYEAVKVCLSSFLFEVRTILQTLKLILSCTLLCLLPRSSKCLATPLRWYDKVFGSNSVPSSFLLTSNHDAKYWSSRGAGIPNMVFLSPFVFKNFSNFQADESIFLFVFLFILELMYPALAQAMSLADKLLSFWLALLSTMESLLVGWSSTSTCPATNGTVPLWNVVCCTCIYRPSWASSLSS